SVFFEAWRLKSFVTPIYGSHRQRNPTYRLCIGKPPISAETKKQTRSQQVCTSRLANTLQMSLPLPAPASLLIAPPYEKGEDTLVSLPDEFKIDLAPTLACGFLWAEGVAHV